MISLRSKVLRFFVLGSVIAVLLQLCFNLFLFRIFARHFESELYESVAAQLAEQIVRRGGTDDAVRLVFAQLGELNPVFDPYLLDEQGRVVEAAADALRDRRVDLTAIRRSLAPRSWSVSPCGTDPSGALPCAAFSVSGVNLTQGFRYVYLVVARDLQPRFLNTSGILLLLRHTGVGMLLGIGVVSVFAVLLSKYLLRELRQVTRAVGCFARGEFDVRCRPHGNDEVSLLGESVNQMADAVLQRREELVRSAEERRRWGDSLLHDLRRPVAALKLQLESWAASKGEKGSQDEGVRREKVEASLRSEALILSALDEDVGAPLVAGRELFFVNELLRSAAGALEGVAAERRITLHLQLAESLPRAFGRPQDVYRIALNLIDNALRYNEPGGSVAVQSFETHGLVIFQVEDTGIGLSPADRDRVFDYSYRGSTGREANPAGTGLGLMIVRKLLVAQGGTLRLESEVGRGTRITCALPGEFNRIVTLAEANLPAERGSRSTFVSQSGRSERSWSLTEAAALLFLPLVSIVLPSAVPMTGWSALLCVLAAASLWQWRPRRLQQGIAVLHRASWVVGGLMLLDVRHSEATVLYYGVLLLLAGLSIPECRSLRAKGFAVLWGAAGLAMLLYRGKSLEVAIGVFVFLSGMLIARQLMTTLFKSLRLRVGVSLFVLSCLVANAQAYLAASRFGSIMHGAEEGAVGSIEAAARVIAETVRGVDGGAPLLNELQQELAFVGACLPRTEFRSLRYDGVVQAETVSYGLAPSVWSAEAMGWILSRFDDGSSKAQEWRSAGRTFRTATIPLDDGAEILASATESKVSEFVLRRVGQQYVIYGLLWGWLTSVIPVLLVDQKVLKRFGQRFRDISALAKGVGEGEAETAPIATEIALLEDGIRDLSKQIAASMAELQCESQSIEALFRAAGRRLARSCERLNSLLERHPRGEVHALSRENERQSQLLGDLSYLFRLQRQPRNFEMLYVRELIDAALLDAASAQVDSNLPTITIDVGEQLLVEGDERLLIRVCGDIIEDMIEFSTAHGASIVGRADRDCVVVSFSPVRNDVACAEAALLLAETVLAAHGGSVDWATSTTLTLTLPAISTAKSERFDRSFS